MSAGSINPLKILKFKAFRNAAAWFSSSPRVFKSKYYDSVDPMPARYGGKSNVTVLPGTGIGPEIMKSTLEILDAAQAPLSYEIMEIGMEDEDDFEHVLISVRRNKVAIKANIEVRGKNPMLKSRNVLLRQHLDLFVYVLPCKTFPGMTTKYGEFDLVVVRQNTEGEYLMLEHEPVPGNIESLKVISRYNSERIAEYAYQYALANHRRQITVIHTADVLQVTEGLFLQAALKVAAKYPQIKTTVKEAGVCLVDLLNHPKKYDIMLATNLTGGMVSNIINGMLGTPAMSAGTNLSETGIAVFEPGIRNKGSSIVDKGIANPTAMVMAACDLLHYLGHHKTSDVIKNALYRNLVFDKLYTQDLGGKATTAEMTENIVRHVRNLLGPSSRDTKPSTVKHKRWPVNGIPNGDDDETNNQKSEPS